MLLYPELLALDALEATGGFTMVATEALWPATGEMTRCPFPWGVVGVGFVTLIAILRASSVCMLARTWVRDGNQKLNNKRKMKDGRNVKSNSNSTYENAKL